MFSNSRGNYAPLHEEANGHRFSKLGANTHIVQRWLPDGKTLFRIILGCTFALGVIAVLKTTGTSESVRRIVTSNSKGSSCSTPDCAKCFSAAADAKEDVGAHWAFDWKRDGFKYGLSESQCDVAFPGLWQDLDTALDTRNGANVTMEELDDSMEGEGAIRCMILDGQVSHSLNGDSLWAHQLT